MDADPEELLVWLKGDGGAERDLQISALEQLCKTIQIFCLKSRIFFEFVGMLVLMCDNTDRCFEQ